MNPETLILGGMLTNICMWSGHTSPSMISTPFHWQSWRSISRISNLFSAKNTFRLYFGANTIWYLQFHFVCAKLLLSMVTFFIDKSSKYVLGSTGRSNLLYHIWRIFSHRLTSFEPRDYRVVFVIQKRSTDDLFVLLFTRIALQGIVCCTYKSVLSGGKYK